MTRTNKTIEALSPKTSDDLLIRGVILERINEIETEEKFYYIELRRYNRDLERAGQDYQEIKALQRKIYEINIDIARVSRAMNEMKNILAILEQTGVL